MCPQIACLKGCKITLVAFVGLFSTMGFLMSPQRTWIRVTLVAFFLLFSTVCFRMSPQIACITGCIIILDALVWLFSSVHFQMCSQCSWIRAGIVTLVALVGLFSTLRFQVFPQIACPREYIITLAAFVWPLTFTNFHQFHWSLWSVIVFAKITVAKILIHHNQESRELKRREKEKNAWSKHYCCRPDTGAFDI